MKLRIGLTLCFLFISYLLSLAQFGAQVGEINTYEENVEARKAEQNGDYSKAKAIWEKQEARGDISAQNHLGYLYETMGDYDRAISYYLKAANSGNTHAMLNLARIYYTGKGVSRNYKEALKWFRKAAEYDSGVAMYNLGYMYLKGKGVEKSAESALRWYSAAAAKGHEDAQKAVEILSKNNFWFIF